jgi:hypothetical protein
MSTFEFGTGGVSLVAKVLKRSVRAYWCWTERVLLCVPCWEASGLPGQVQYLGDLIRDERCARCVADPAADPEPVDTFASRRGGSR